MTKGLKYGALSLVASAFLSTSVFAGTVNTTSYKIADEYIKGQASTTISVGDKLFTAAVAPITIAGYSPTTIPAISLANGTVVLSASSGNLASATAGTHKLVIMEDVAAADSDIVIGVYANAFAGKLSFASDAAVSYTNGKSYRLATVLNANAVVGTVLTDANSTAAAAGDVTLSAVAQNTETVNFKTELFSTDTQTLRDDATNVLVTTPVQMSASVTTATSAVIDAINEAQKKFVANAPVTTTTATIAVTLAAAVTDLDAVGTTDTASIVLTNTKALPAGTTAAITYVSSIGADGTAGTCTVATGGLSTTCTITDTGFDPAAAAETGLATVVYTVPGTIAINDNTFNALVTYDFTTGGQTSVDYTTTAPLLNAAAGAWTYNGYNVKVPYILNSGDTSTFVKLVNKNALTAAVTANIQTDTGVKCTGFALASLPANQAKVYNDTAITAAALAATGATGDACASVTYPYSVELFATVNPANIETAAYQRMGTNGQRSIPVYTNRNADANGARDGK